MGSAFWIFIIIAVIQGVASVAAKSAEKRKKAERRAEIARQDASGEGVTPVGKFRSQEELEQKLDSQGEAQKVIAAMLGLPQEAAQPTRRASKAKKASGAAASDVGIIRQNRLKELRRQRARKAAANPTAPRTSNAPAVSPGPSRSSPSAVPDAGRPQPSTSPSQPPSQSQSQRRRDERKAAETVHPRTRDTAIVARPSQAIGDPAKDLPRLWRSPSSIRQAILLSELLQPPVALRNHQAGGFGETVASPDGGRSG